GPSPAGPRGPGPRLLRSGRAMVGRAPEPAGAVHHGAEQLPRRGRGGLGSGRPERRDARGRVRSAVSGPTKTAQPAETRNNRSRSSRIDREATRKLEPPSEATRGLPSAQDDRFARPQQQTPGRLWGVSGGASS